MRRATALQPHGCVWLRVCTDLLRETSRKVRNSRPSDTHEIDPRRLLKQARGARAVVQLPLHNRAKVDARATRAAGANAAGDARTTKATSPSCRHRRRRYPRRGPPVSYFLNRASTQSGSGRERNNSPRRDAARAVRASPSARAPADRGSQPAEAPGLVRFEAAQHHGTRAPRASDDPWASRRPRTRAAAARKRPSARRSRRCPSRRAGAVVKPSRRVAFARRAKRTCSLNTSLECSRDVRAGRISARPEPAVAGAARPGAARGAEPLRADLLQLPQIRHQETDEGVLARDGNVPRPSGDGIVADLALLGSSRGRHQYSNAAKIIQSGLRLAKRGLDAGTSS